jgi:hypothetical protein
MATRRAARIIVLTMQPLAGTDLEKATRWVLKRLLRQHGLRCVDISYTTPRLARGSAVLRERPEIKTMDMRKFVGEKYLNVKDVAEGPLTANIENVRQGKRFDKAELLLDSGDVLALNATNTRTLAKSYGWDSNFWVGKRIEVRAGKAEFHGDLVDSAIVVPITPGLTAAEKLEPVAAKAVTKAVGRDKADNSDMADDIPF